MKKIIALSLAALSITALAGERYKDRLFDVNIQKDVVYSSNTKFMDKTSLHEFSKSIAGLGEQFGMALPEISFYENETKLVDTDMHMDLYTPKNDSEKNRAVVLVAHGGAFLAGSKDDFSQKTVKYCDSLAARGYVTASVQYRLGTRLQVVEGIKDTLRVDSAAFARTVYRGVQDVGAAIRYIRKNADKLGINPNKIFIMGNSSGGILALENLYTNSKKDFPAYINDANIFIGELDEYGEQGVSSTANAAVALWGAVHDPKIVENSNSPVLMMHGTDDHTVYIDAHRPLGNPKSMLMHQIPEDYSTYANLLLSGYEFDIQTPIMYGSAIVDSILKKRNVDHETYFVEGEGHEFYDESQYTSVVQDKIFSFLYKQATATETAIPFASRTFAKANNILMGAENRNFTYIGQKNSSYEICDLRGRTQLSGPVSTGEVVDLSDLRNGVYVLSVHGTRIMRFAISR